MPEYDSTGGYPQQGYPQPQYPQPTYGQPQYGYPQPGGYPQGSYGPQGQPASNGVAVAALVLGIITLLCGTVGIFLVFGPFVGVATGIAAVVCGGIGISKAGKMGGYRNGVAVAGLVTGILGLIASILMSLIFGVAIMAYMDDPDAFYDYLDDDTTDSVTDDDDYGWDVDSDDDYGLDDDAEPVDVTTMGTVEDAADVIGKWEIFGSSDTDDAGQSTIAYMRSLGYDITVDIKDGGIVTMDIIGIQYEGTWEKTGEKVILTVDGEKLDAVVDKDGHLIVGEGNAVLTFAKVGTATAATPSGDDATGDVTATDATSANAATTDADATGGETAES